jgi:hypothetical protein
MKKELTKLTVDLTFDRGLYQTKAEWPEYDIELDIYSASCMLVLIAHQFIDTQPEQTQAEFEEELMKRFKEGMAERYNTIEPTD